MTGGGSGRSAGAATTLGASALGALGNPGRVGSRASCGRGEPSFDAQALDCSTRQIVGVATLFRRHRSLDRGYRIWRSRDRRRG